MHLSARVSWMKKVIRWFLYQGEHCCDSGIIGQFLLIWLATEESQSAISLLQKQTRSDVFDGNFSLGSFSCFQSLPWAINTAQNVCWIELFDEIIPIFWPDGMREHRRNASRFDHLLVTNATLSWGASLWGAEPKHFRRSLAKERIATSQCRLPCSEDFPARFRLPSFQARFLCSFVWFISAEITCLVFFVQTSEVISLCIVRGWAKELVKRKSCRDETQLEASLFTVTIF